MRVPFARSDYDRTSAPSGGPQSATNLPRSRTGRPVLQAAPEGSHVHRASIGQGGVQLDPGSIATSTPQTFSVASSPTELLGFGVDPSSSSESRTARRPLSTRFEPVQVLRDFNHWFTRVTPSGLASRTQAVWQFRPVSALSGLLPALPSVPWFKLPPASIKLLRQFDGEGLSPSLDDAAPRGARPDTCTRSSRRPFQQPVPTHSLTSNRCAIRLSLSRYAASSLSLSGLKARVSREDR